MVRVQRTFSGETLAVKVLEGFWQGEYREEVGSSNSLDTLPGVPESASLRILRFYLAHMDLASSPKYLVHQLRETYVYQIL